MNQSNATESNIIVAPKRTYRQKLIFNIYIMCTQMQRLKLNINAANQVKHNNCSLKSKSIPGSLVQYHQQEVAVATAGTGRWSSSPRHCDRRR